MKQALVGLGMLLLVVPAAASPPIGMYALVDKVVLEPNETSPQRIQIWGVFAASVDGGTEREAPVYGYLYFQMDEANAPLARQEWADLKKHAGTGQCLAFAGRDNGKLGARVRKPGETPSRPEMYPVALGLIRLRATLPLADELRSFPVPTGAVDGSRVEAGPVTLSVRNIVSQQRPKAQYVFEIENGAGEKEKSEPQSAGEKETKWTPRMKIKAGEKYTWRAWVTHGNWKGPVASAQIVGKLAP